MLHSLPWPCSRPPLTQASSGDSWTLMGISGSVSCGVTAPSLGSCVHKVWFVSSKSLFSPVLCKLWSFYGGVNGDLLQEGLCQTQVCCTQSPCPAASHCWPVHPRETLRHISGSGSIEHAFCALPRSEQLLKGKTGYFHIHCYCE